MSVESDEEQSDVGDLISEADGETLDQIASAIADQVSTQASKNDAEEIVSKVINEMKNEFPELEIRSKNLDNVLTKFRKKKLSTIQSKGQYRTKLDYIEQYFTEEVAAETSDELTSEDIDEFSDWREYQSLDRKEPLSKVTLKDDLYLFREFVTYMAKHKLVPLRFVHVIEIPSIDYESGEGVDEKLLDPELAEASLEHLRRYHYASRDNVAMEIFCSTGRRRGGVVGLDVESYNPEELLLKFEHSEETPLKKDENSERKVKISEQTAKVVEEYIANNRVDAVDEDGRKPLLTTTHGRISPSTLKKLAYRWTRPCKVGFECPHNRDPAECDAALDNNQAYKCPSSRSPHHIRTGFITDRKNCGVSAEAIEFRADVSPPVQRLHYDLPDESDERARYEDEFLEASKDSDSGFN